MGSANYLWKNKNNKKFNEISLLENQKIGYPIKSGNEFKLLVNRIIKYGDIGSEGTN